MLIPANDMNHEFMIPFVLICDGHSPDCGLSKVGVVFCNVK